MSEKSTAEYLRLKIMYLHKFLMENTDEEHRATMPDITAYLDEYGISSGRKALYEDIEALRHFGDDILTERGRNAGYWIASRDFELAELKLLADAICCSRFLTEKKSQQLLKKIEGLCSIHEAKQIHRQVYTVNRVKSMNENILQSVDAIHNAIAEKKKISFKYFDYDINKKKKYREGVRICSPYALSWDDERYYLIAYNERREVISNYRVDRMEKVEVTDEPIRPKPKDFVVADYMNSSFSMFSGKEQEVKLRFDAELVNAVLDRFGMNAHLITEKGRTDSFTVRVNIKTEQPQTFFGWLFQFGAKAEILAPENLRERFKDYVSEVLKMY